MSNRLQLLIPADLDAALKKAAHRARVSKGEWVRRAIEAALQQETRTPGSAVDRLAAIGAPTGDIDEMLRDLDKGRGA
jgi:hypothetical protein